MERPHAGSRRVNLTEDRETFERNRLQKRTGGYYQFVDSADIFKPDPNSTHYMGEKSRFTKDFNVADQAVRQIVNEK